MTNENEDIPYIPFDAPLHLRELDIPIPDWLEKERRKVDIPGIVSVNNLNSSASFDGSTASPTSASDATESSTTTASSGDASPNDSIPNSSTSNEPEEETFLQYGRKMTWETDRKLEQQSKTTRSTRKKFQNLL